MRFVYVDESGTSGKAPFLIVAGVVIDMDRQFIRVARHISKLVNKYVAAEDREGFSFHATNLFSGSGKTWGNRAKYSLAHRCEALKEFLAIPSKFHLPVIVGFIRRKPSPTGQSTQARQKTTQDDHALAFSYCCIGAEKYMRSYARPRELAKITAEDNTQTKDKIKLMHNVLRGRYPSALHFMKRLSADMGVDSEFLPLTKIIDAVSFEGKKDAILLQIADACALTIRHFLEGRTDTADFINAFTLGRPECITREIEKARSCHGGKLEVKCWL